MHICAEKVPTKSSQGGEGAWRQQQLSVQTSSAQPSSPNQSICIFIGISDPQTGFGAPRSADGTSPFKGCFQHPGAKCVRRRESGMGSPLQHFLQHGSMELTPPAVLWAIYCCCYQQHIHFAKRKHRLLRAAQIESRRVEIRTQTVEHKSLGSSPL